MGQGVGIADKIRSAKGVRDVEISFCPGEGWVGARYISDDLDDMVDDMVASPDSAEYKEGLEIFATYTHTMTRAARCASSRFFWLKGFN